MIKRRIGAIALAVAMVFTSVPAASAITPAGKVMAAAKFANNSVSIKAGEKKVLKIKGAKAKSKIKWSTSDKKVASVSKKGEIKGITEGKCVITAKVDGKSIKCNVSVSAYLSQTSLTLEEGDDTKLKVIGAPGTVEWSSSDEEVVGVSAKGVVDAYGTKEGETTSTATVTAKVGNKTYTCKVTVTLMEDSDEDYDEEYDEDYDEEYDEESEESDDESDIEEE
ncbi:MAG: Ig-like domain-containing protein [Lachnospiraceae bacterium]|nr:Ig-like domain-containing protein [Lachnospiraceae bacterium]